MAIIVNPTNYTDGDVVTPKLINDLVDTALNANKLTQTPDCTDANKTGTPSVVVTEDGRLKFSNLKGAKGDTGPQGIQGPQGIAGQGGNLSAANTDAVMTTKTYGMKPVSVPSNAGDPLTSNLVEIPIYDSTNKLSKDYISGLPYLTSVVSKGDVILDSSKTLSLDSLVTITPSTYSVTTLRSVSCAANGYGLYFSVTGPDYKGNCDITFAIGTGEKQTWVVSIYVTDIFGNTKTAYVNVKYI